MTSSADERAPTWEELLEAGRLEQRVRAAIVLGTRGQPAVLPALIRALDDDDPVATEAAWALGQMGDRRAVGPLIELLEQGRYWPARLNAAAALGRLRDPAAFAALREVLLQTDDPTAPRAAAAAALGALGDHRAIAALNDRLQDGDPYVRRGARSGLRALLGWRWRQKLRRGTY
jgi:HEAT repeat protein